MQVVESEGKKGKGGGQRRSAIVERERKADATPKIQ